MASTGQTQQQFLPTGTIHQVSPTVTANVITTNAPVTAYNRRAGKILGIVILVCAVTVIVAEVVQLAAVYHPFPVGAGLWAGALYLPTGILGIISGKRGSRCAIIAFMTLAILSACVAIPAFSMHVLGAVTFGSCRHYHYEYAEYNSTHPADFNYRYRRDDGCEATMVSVAVLMSLASLTALVASIVASAYCCRAVCGGGCCGEGGSTRTVVVYYNSGPQGGGGNVPVYVPDVGLVPPPPLPQAGGAASSAAFYESPPPYALTSSQAGAGAEKGPIP